MSVASASSTPSLLFVLDRSGREDSVAGSGDGASDPGASAPPNCPSLLDPFTGGIHPPPGGFHEPKDPPWGRPVEPVEPVRPSAPVVAVGDVVVEPAPAVAVGDVVVLPLPLAALAHEGSESHTRTDSPQTRAHTRFATKADLERFATKADLEVCAATPSCFLLARDAPPPLPPPDRSSSAQWMQTMRT